MQHSSASREFLNHVRRLIALVRSFPISPCPLFDLQTDEVCGRPNAIPTWCVLGGPPPATQLVEPRIRRTNIWWKARTRKTSPFNATFSNLLNQYAITSYWEGFNSNFLASSLFPLQIFNGAAFYQKVETGYNAQAGVTGNGNVNNAIVLNGLYGQPNLWQISRHIRLGAQFTW